jgi:eukaryotic-like serine/threonine-protein kinase
LLVGTIVSTWQALRAYLAGRETAAALVIADARLGLARRAVDDMYTQVAEKWLAQQPKLTQLQREFLKKALAYYEQFSTEAGSDPRFRYGAMRALQRVGAIQAALGQHTAAEQTWRHVVAQCTGLVPRYPDRPEFRLCLAEARIELASLLRKAGRPYGVDKDVLFQTSEGRARLIPRVVRIEMFPGGL